MFDLWISKEVGNKRSIDPDVIFLLGEKEKQTKQKIIIKLYTDSQRGDSIENFTLNRKKIN